MIDVVNRTYLLLSVLASKNGSEVIRFAIEVLPIFGEPSATVEPGEGTLDDPVLGQHRKSLLI